MSRALRLFVASSLVFQYALLQCAHAANAADEHALISLRSPDGQSMPLEKLDLRVAVHGPLALTETEMVFRNPEDRRMEGRFLMMLPPAASVSRWAKEVNGKLMEGEVLERKRAQRIYREILHTMRDPALLEQDQGNRFTARVFPIEARGTVRLLLSYTQYLSLSNSGRALRIPIKGMAAVKRFSLNVFARPMKEERFGFDGPLPEMERREKDKRVHLKGFASNFSPTEDVVVRFQPEDKKGIRHRARGLRAGPYRIISYLPDIPKPAMRARSKWVLYLDASASTAAGFPRRMVLLSGLLRSIAEDGAIAAAFLYEMSVKPITLSHTGNGAGAVHEQIMTALRNHGPIGGTDLEEVLKHIGDMARADRAAQTFVLVSDGIATFGARRLDGLLKALGAWPGNDVLHVLVPGGKRDGVTLKALAEAGHGRVVDLPFHGQAKEQIAMTIAELRRGLGATLEFQAEDVEWSHPRSIRDVQPGRELVVFQKLTPDAKDRSRLTVRNTGERSGEAKSLKIKVEKSQADFYPFLEQQAIGGRLAALHRGEQRATRPGHAEMLRMQQIDLSMRYRVLCPHTSFLVLESSEDYNRFGIERFALADILHVGSNGIALRSRLTPELRRLKVASDRMRASVVGALRNEVSVEFNGDLLRDAIGDLTYEMEMPLTIDFGLMNEYDNELAKPVRLRTEDVPLWAVFDRLLASTRWKLILRGGALRITTKDLPEYALINPFQAASQPEPEPETDIRFESPEDQSAAPVNPFCAMPHRQALASNVHPSLPHWARALKMVPEDAELEKLRKKIGLKPRNRILRNQLVDKLKRAKKWSEMKSACMDWLRYDADNPQVFEFLGEASKAVGDRSSALLAYASIVESGPRQAAVLSRAGFMLLTLKEYGLAIKVFERALEERADNPNVHRGLALASWMNGKHKQAVDVLRKAIDHGFHSRYGDVVRILKHELAYILRDWMNSDPKAKEECAKIAKEEDVDPEREDALRVSVHWETDANDVDLHILDPNLEECYYSHKETKAGLQLYEDLTRGLGPEVIRCEKTIKGTYYIGVKYYDPGPMGMTRGIILVQRPTQDNKTAHPKIVPFSLSPATFDDSGRSGSFQNEGVKAILKVTFE